MKNNNEIKNISNKDLDKLQILIKIIDPQEKVFRVTDTIIEEKKKIKSYTYKRDDNK